MSITAETAQEHAKDLAVLCCRAEAGTVITPENLEDPAIFLDLEESGLLEFSEAVLTIEQVLGTTLKKTTDALIPLTKELLEGVSEGMKEVHLNEKKEVETSETIATPIQTASSSVTSGQTIKIHITEGKGIDLELPLMMATQLTETVNPAPESIIPEQVTPVIPAPVLENSNQVKEKVIRSVRHDHLKIDQVIFGEETKIEGTTLILRKMTEICAEAVELEQLVEDMTLEIITPDKGEIFIKTQVTIKEHANMERPGPLAAHKASDYITQEIREALKKADESLVIHSEEIIQKRRIGNKKVLIIKEIMGQGAMHDNLIMPIEPVGTFGAKPNVDLGNLPILLAPTEVLDGGIHALTCIGPASKETSRHYWREPLVKEAMADEEIDLVGVMFVGSPQANTEKYYVSKRLGMTVEAMDIDGAIVTTEGFGNNHIDFASHMEEIGKRGIKVVGDSYSAVQGALVVGNSEMGAMVDNNKSKQGIENEILSNNTLCREDAIRDLAMLKTLMGGGTIKPAERKWNPNVKQNNIEIIEKTTGRKIDLEENEQSLPKSKKRQEIYEKE